eukprot:SAG11_NODE_3083_length_2706_cov_6.647104_2_plen_88_part_00
MELPEPASYWRALCPDLHVGGYASSPAAATPCGGAGDAALPLEIVSELRGRMDRDGYFDLTASQLRVRQTCATNHSYTVTHFFLQKP